METTPASSLTRYRPVLLSITGFTAAYCAWIVYKSYQSPPAPSSEIRRTNAIRGPRARPQRPQRQNEPATAQSEEQRPTEPPTWDRTALDAVETLGTIRVANREGVEIPVELDPHDLPTEQSLWDTHRLSSTAAREALERIHTTFVQRFLIAHFHRNPRNAESADAFRAAREWLAERIPVDTLDRFFTDMQQQVQQMRTGGINDDVSTISGTEMDIGGFSSRDPSSGLNLKQLLFHIAENQAREAGHLHRGFRCDQCGTSQIRGTRWKCANCVDIDLCNDCHATSMHYRDHVFYEIRIPTYHLSNFQPVQERFYPGRPMDMPHSVPVDIRNQLVEETDYEKAEVEGLYNQFTCLAATPLADSSIGFAMNKQVFTDALLPLSRRAPLRPNLVFDRLFLIFDTDKDGLVNFQEFVKGVSFVRSKAKDKARRKRIFEAYDIEGNGFVSRKDFLRIFRAYFRLTKDIALDMISKNETENGLRDAVALAATSQTLSSNFTEDRIPRGDLRLDHAKKPDEFGDTRHQPGQKIMESNQPDSVDRKDIIGHAWESRAQFPFHSDGNELRAEEPLSVRDFIYLAPRNARGNPTSSIARDQSITFAYNGRSVREAREEAWSERWKRRNFYTDEEEGVQEHGGFDLKSKPREINGYEIPTAEFSLGHEAMYSLMTDTYNELLDPLFKAKEDLAIEVGDSTAEIERWEKEIASWRSRKEEEKKKAEQKERDPLLATAAAAEAEDSSRAANGNKKSPAQPQPQTNPIPTRRDLDHIFYGSLSREDGQGLGAGVENMNEAVANVEAEVNEQSLDDLLNDEGYQVQQQTDGASSPAHEINGTHMDTTEEAPAAIPQVAVHSVIPESGVDPRYSHPHLFTTSRHPNYDPTMPQFMPNSAPDASYFEPVEVVLDPMKPGPSTSALLEDIPKGIKHKDLRSKMETEVLRQFENMFLGWKRDEQNGIVKNSATRETLSTAAGRANAEAWRREREVNGWENEPAISETRLQRLAELQDAQKEIEARGGPGRLSFEEFDEIVNKGKLDWGDFRWLESWLEFCYF